MATRLAVGQQVAPVAKDQPQQLKALREKLRAENRGKNDVDLGFTERALLRRIFAKSSIKAQSVGVDCDSLNVAPTSTPTSTPETPMSKTNYAEKRAKRITKTKAGQAYLAAQKALGILPDDKDVGDDAYCLDLSYNNPDLRFTGDSLIRQIVGSENGSVTHAGQNILNNVRTVTVLMPGCGNINRVANALADGGLEVVVFAPDILSLCHQPLRYRMRKCSRICSTTAKPRIVTVI